MSALSSALRRVAAGVAVWAGVLFLAGEFRPGGVFTLYTSMLVVYTVHQVWTTCRDRGAARGERS